MPSLSHQGTPDNSNDTDAIAERQDNGPSEYQLRRQANIEENRKLLSSLGLSASHKLLKKVKGKRREKGKGYVFCLFCAAYPTNHDSTFLQIVS
jgi:hypothetical protein